MRLVHVGADAQNAAVLHRFEAVFDHVVERLLHLISIQLKCGQVGTQFLFDHDFAVLNLGRKELDRFFDNRVDVLRMQLWPRRADRAQELGHNRIEPVKLGARDVD